MRILLKIIGQTIALGFVIFLGTFLIWEQFPGNKIICDAEQLNYLFLRLIFVIISIALIINSWVFLKKNSSNKYRITIIIFCFLINLIFIFIRSLIFNFSYGNEKHIIKNTDIYETLVEIKLYENGKFYAWTYDMGCQLENVGTYIMKENKLTLIFESEKSKYLGTQFLIKNDVVLCLKDCEYNNELRMK